MTDLNPMENVHEIKRVLRQSMHQRLRALTTEQCATGSAKIVRRLMLDDAWTKSGGVVAMFSGFKKEPDLLTLLPWLEERGVRAAFFAIEENGLMSPYLVRDGDDLLSGKFGVLEPKTTRSAKLDFSDLGVVLTPGLAFSRNNGARLGLGKGHYDRVFGHLDCQARRIGVAFDLQIISFVPAEPHDAAMQALVSESALRLIGDVLPPS